jgi:hypothetical protein
VPDPDDRPHLPSLSRRTLLGGAAAGVALASLGMAPGFGVPAASGTSATPTLTIDPGDRLGRIGIRALGFSFEKSTLATPLFQASNTDLVALFRLLGPGVLRLGGNSVDRTDWDPSGAGSTPGVVAPPDLAGLRGFLDAVDWQVLYGTPFVSTGASAATVAGEAHTAAGVLGARLDGVELCNEPDLFAANPAHAALAGTFSLFQSRWNSFAAAVRAATPGIALTGPACCLLQTIGTWTAPFAGAESGGLSQLTQHYYRGFGGPGQTIDLLLAPDPLLGPSLDALAAAAGVAGAPAGFRLTETNSFASGGQPGVSNTFASALWAVEHVLRSLEGGAVGLNLHNSGTGAGYPALVQQGGVVTEIRPLYLGLLLAARLGTGDLVATSPSTPLPSLRSHAVHGADGTIRVVLVNVDPTIDQPLSLSLPRTIGSATVERLTGDGLAATTGTRLGGSDVGVDGSFEPGPPEVVGGGPARATLAVTVAAASAVVVAITLEPTATPSTTTTTAGHTGSSTTVAPTGPAPAALPVTAEPRYTG